MRIPLKERFMMLCSTKGPLDSFLCNSFDIYETYRDALELMIDL